MHLIRLSLEHFRNYEKQDLTLAPGPVLFVGDNAQGKTNLLEAVFLLATGRSERAATDADFIAWDVRDGPQPYARVTGTAIRQRDGTSGPRDVTVEVTVLGRPGAAGLVASRRVKLDGVPKRASDVAGAIAAVLFTTDDMELVKGAPGGRRRYLDVMLSQADRTYARALPRYTKVVVQRNALLKRAQEGAADPDELAYWDEEMAREGATLLVQRAGAAERLAESAAALHARLSGARERFALSYEPRFVEGWPAGRIAGTSGDEVAAVLLNRLRATHQRDVAAGLTLVGPHRDDLAMQLDGEPAAAFASRGQQRTAALALRLAEARFLFERSGEQPVLLLDDILSELDEGRRTAVRSAIEADQALITSADADRFDAGFVSRAQLYFVRAGMAIRG